MTVGGRPRDPRADDAILAATLAIIAEDGYVGLSMERVAARAGVGKATIYRRWSSKDEVLLAAVERLSTEVPAPDTGSLRGDLEAIAGGLLRVFAAPGTAGLVSALVAPMARDPGLARALRSGFLSARRTAARAALERGRERGEVRGDADLEIAIDLLAAPFYYRLLISDDPIDEAFARDVVEAVVSWASGAATR